jgi:hypothetical protein
MDKIVQILDASHFNLKTIENADYFVWFLNRYAAILFHTIQKLDKFVQLSDEVLNQKSDFSTLSRDLNSGRVQFSDVHCT